MIGKTISHYRILEKLGEGGMGVVYKARDTHLDRFVALKILPAERVADADRKRRFVQEAKAASSLNHPHIVTIHDIDEADGVHFIAMEHVQGKTLDQLIPRHGMRLNEALKTAVQMADALAAAHAVGIVHRDLKPANVMVSENGSVKILDFGLAKLAERTDGSDPDAKTVQLGSDSQTEEGTILGTVSYMSPEQAEGKQVDARSDIFSFGSLLYEMVTGQRAFRGDSNLAIMTSILREEPKRASEIVKGLPSELEKIINRCLRKERDRRWQTMVDVKNLLQESKEEVESGGHARVLTPQRGRHWQLVWPALAFILLAIGSVVVWLSRSTARVAEAPLRAVPLTTYPGEESQASFSPDGNQVAFAWNGEKQDNYDIYIKLIGTPGHSRLTSHPAADYGPAWSPDGRSIAFLRDLPEGKSAVLLIPAIGGPERKLAETVTPIGVDSFGPDARCLAWSSSGRRWKPRAHDSAEQSRSALARHHRQVDRLCRDGCQSGGN
jgi:serine/threonine protein kinase